MSSGYIKELAFVGFAYALLDIATKCENGEIKSGLFTSYKTNYRDNKRIDRRIAKLKSELLAVMKKNVKHNKAVQLKQNQIMRDIISIAPKTCQPDTLALYTLWYRFQPHERDKPLHEDFLWLTKIDGQLFGIIELLEKVLNYNEILEMEKLSEKIARF